jgi:hypothetical protein
MILITYFEKFVSNIQPSDERVEAVAEGHNTLRKHLTDEAALDFPVDTSFLSGSYARHTAIDPIKDADIILVLQEKVVSDDKKTPFPREVLEDLKSAIDDFYEEVDLQTQRRSIQVWLREDDVRMDVVPAIAPDGKDEKLFVPDYEQGKWIESHPSKHISFATEVNADNDGRFVRVAKALKWWRTEKLEKTRSPKSFLTEVIVAYNIDSGASNLGEAFAGTLKNILKAYRTNRDQLTLPEIPDPALSDNDLAKTCGWTVANFMYFYDRVVELSATAEKANSNDTSKEETIRLWQSVFGDVYPATLSQEEERVTKSFSTLPEPAGRRELPYQAKISAFLIKGYGGPVIQSYPNDGRRLPKGQQIRFTLDETNVTWPYEIRWIVRNHGREARRAHQLFRPAYNGGRQHEEITGFTGHHFMDCEIWKDNRLMAKARHIVNVS